MLTTEEIEGVRFSVAGLNETVAQLAQIDHGARARVVAFVNPHSVMSARRDPEFAEALREADFITPDGIGIIFASRIRGGAIGERVCGPDIFPLVCAKLNSDRPGTRMFFLGTTEETLGVLSERFVKDYPQLVVAGTLAPPFRPEFTRNDEDSMVAAVNGSGAEVLWIGLGAPKQEKLAIKLRDRLSVKLIGPVGGVFDFYTGRVKLPPMWMQRLGLIWLFRLCQEPRRLWRRNLDGFIFLGRVIWFRLGGGRE